MMKYFASNNTLMELYLMTVVTSLGLSWCITLPGIIILRNNVTLTKRYMKTRKYQIFEKFVLVPVGRFVSIVYKMDIF